MRCRAGFTGYYTSSVDGDIRIIRTPATSPPEYSKPCRRLRFDQLVSTANQYCPARQITQRQSADLSN